MIVSASGQRINELTDENDYDHDYDERLRAPNNFERHHVFDGSTRLEPVIVLVVVVVLVLVR
jgi:hypothetical protein